MSDNLTLDEIAKRAGVSRTTASRVLNNGPNVRPEVRARVQRIIDETGYRPHPVARSLASQQSHVIGLVLPRRTEVLFNDPYFPRLTQGVAQACNDHNYTLALFLLQTAADEEKFYPRLSHKGLLDGIVIQVGQIGDNLIARLLESDVPTVVAGRPLNQPTANYVDVDNVAGAYTAVMHLLRLGHKRIGTITGEMHTTAALDRYTGYCKALQEHGLPVDETLVREGYFTEIGGYEAMQRLLPHKPDAIFSASDAMSLGALRAIHEAGLNVPRDIALVSFDDLPPATIARPQLTTVHQPVLAFGIKAVEMLLDVIKNGPTPPRQIIMETKLVIRDSCGAPTR
ncbi:MAG TPA: LacI family DNA-binding transcriptional regulator [Anaerolineae bacterium]|nr:LacI family DNA-binding transcriptional regulator [Anaerolineae bacterium]HQK12927.1 LacI family DNA-binding transcriptional regulator [Anaerolineae bacterium]